MLCDQQETRSFPPLRLPAVFLTLLAGLAGLLPAGTVSVLGDVVYLKNGNRIEGEVTPGSSEGRIRVTIDTGVFFEFPLGEVERVENKKSPAKEFEDRLKTVKRDDLDGLLELAMWARERKLRSKAEEVYRIILKVDPNNPVARKGLGYAVYRNRWIRESDLKNKYGLVVHEGEWVPPEEKERRLLEKLRGQVAEDFRGADSDNRFIQEYSIRRLLERKDPRLRAVFLEYLDHADVTVRIVAVQALASLPGPGAEEKGRGRNGRRGGTKGRSTRGSSDSTAGKDRSLEVRLAEMLLDRTLKEENALARRALVNALMKMHHRLYFQLALKTAGASPNALHRDRAAEGALFSTRKAWVPELMRALGKVPPEVPMPGNPSIRRVLQRMFRQDFEYRVRDWLNWWDQNEARYDDRAG